MKVQNSKPQVSDIEIFEVQVSKVHVWDIKLPKVHVSDIQFSDIHVLDIQVHVLVFQKTVIVQLLEDLITNVNETHQSSSRSQYH